MHGHQFKRKASLRTDNLVENEVLVYYSAMEEKIVTNCFGSISELKSCG